MTVSPDIELHLPLLQADAIKEFAKDHNLIYEDYSKESHGLGVMHA